MNQQKDHLLNSSLNAMLSEYDRSLDDENLDANELFVEFGSREYLTSLQYNFYCWLGLQLCKDLSVSQPLLTSYRFNSQTNFRSKYLSSEKRKELFNLLEEYIRLIKIKEQIVTPIKVLIGGSFTDPDIQNPNDIDICTLVPTTFKNRKSFDWIPFPGQVKRPDCIDNKFLPEDFSLNRFQAYSRIVHLGNKIAKDKNGVIIQPRQFTSRKIIQLEF